MANKKANQAASTETSNEVGNINEVMANDSQHSEIVDSIEPTPEIVEPKPEPSSEKLTEIRAAIENNWSKLETGEIKPRTKEYILVNSEIIKLEGQEKAELLAIAKAEKDLALKTEMNARAAMVDDFEGMVIEVVKSLTREDLTEEEKQKLYDDKKAFSEKLKNELLAKYKGSSTSVNASTGTGNATSNGATGKEIKDSILSFLAEGKTVTDAVKLTVEKGYSRGTTGAVRTAMKKAGELVAYGENPEVEN